MGIFRRRKKYTCRKCIYYDEDSGLCLHPTYGGVIVEDPDDPPCLHISHEEVVRENRTIPVTQPQVQPPTTTEVQYTPTYIPQPQVQTASMQQVASEPQAYMTRVQTSEFKAPTGIQGLDEVLQGGFWRGKTYLISGEAGTGKTIFSLQFLVTGALMGESGLYVSIDEPSEHVIRGLRTLEWDVDRLIDDGLLHFVDLRTHFRLYARGERQYIDPRAVADAIVEYVTKYNVQRLVVDPIAPLIQSGHSDVLWVREYVRELVFALERLGNVTTIFTSEIPTGSNLLSRFGVEEYLASGVIVLKLEEIYGKVLRVMFIRKMRWMNVQPQKLVFEIAPRVGIVIKGRLEEYIRKFSGVSTSV